MATRDTCVREWKVAESLRESDVGRVADNKVEGVNAHQPAEIKGEKGGDGYDRNRGSVGPDSKVLHATNPQQEGAADGGGLAVLQLGGMSAG